MAFCCFRLGPNNYGLNRPPQSSLLSCPHILKVKFDSSFKEPGFCSGERKKDNSLLKNISSSSRKRRLALASMPLPTVVVTFWFQSFFISRRSNYFLFLVFLEGRSLRISFVFFIYLPERCRKNGRGWEWKGCCSQQVMPVNAGEKK